MVWKILGYRYHPTKKEAMKDVKSSDDAVAYEAGLGWYTHSKSEYKKSWRKRVLGF